MTDLLISGMVTWVVIQVFILQLLDLYKLFQEQKEMNKRILFNISYISLLLVIMIYMISYLFNHVSFMYGGM